VGQQLQQQRLRHLPLAVLALVLVVVLASG
jgi:hypothetical protein